MRRPEASRPGSRDRVYGVVDQRLGFLGVRVEDDRISRSWRAPELLNEARLLPFQEVGLFWVKPNLPCSRALLGHGLFFSEKWARLGAQRVETDAWKANVALVSC